ncbi:MAG: hypothetical protein H0W21_09270 [Actinobacteria bacterium]|nr:hypothetical protein [Actinomycetota bacterium]
MTNELEPSRTTSHALQLSISMAVAALIVALVVMLVIVRLPLDRLPYEQDKGGRSEHVDNSGQGSDNSESED